MKAYPDRRESHSAERRGAGRAAYIETSGTVRQNAWPPRIHPTASGDNRTRWLLGSATIPRVAVLRGLLLDAGGVLTLPTHDSVVAALGPSGWKVDATLLDRAHYAGVHAMDTWSRAAPPAVDDQGQLRLRKYFEGYLRECAAPPELITHATTVLVEERAFSWSRPCPGAREGLQALARIGLRMAVVSNSDGSCARTLSACGLCQVGSGPATSVVAVVDSALVGVEKPHPRIFRMGLDVLGTAPSEAAYVGDSVSVDVAAATSVGMRPLHMDPFGLCPDQDHPHVRSLLELAAKLG